MDMNESNFERRQRQNAERLIKAAMPDVNRAMRDIVRQQMPLDNIGKVFSQQYQSMFASIEKNLRQANKLALNTARLEAANIKIPPLLLDYKSLFPRLPAFQPDLIKSFMPSVRLIQNLQRGQFADIIARIREAVSAVLPPNWRGEDVRIPLNLEALLLDEGLALTWIPPEPVIVKLFNATSPGERRRILGRHWRGICQACIVQLESVEDRTLKEHVHFALKAAHLLRSCSPEGAQSLSANLLDTILRERFDRTDHKTITGQKQRLDIEDYPLRVAIVLGGIWGSHGEFWPSNGDKIPRQFSRHASAHAVSRHQYSRINSLLALMHVVSLIKLLETDLAGP
jgi:hypothetical protein